MARASMSEVIAHVRDLIGDLGESGETHFSDDQVQAALDRRRTEWVELALFAIRSRSSAGAEELKRWVAERSPWEDDAQLLDSSFVPIDTDDYTADPMQGVWTFDASQDGVYINGCTFDVYAAAADLLDTWVTSSSASTTASGGTIVEWETDGQKVKRSGSSGAGSVVDERKSLAASYRAQALPVTSTLRTSGLQGERSWF